MMVRKFCAKVVVYVLVYILSHVRVAAKKLMEFYTGLSFFHSCMPGAYKGRSAFGTYMLLCMPIKSSHKTKNFPKHTVVQLSKHNLLRLGEKGMLGPQGMKGESGDIGPVGPAGQRGMKGNRGDSGEPGDPGEAGQAGTPFNVITLHSQTNITPPCPAGSVRLWEGYSLGFTDGDGFGHGQDLGKPGSCARRFNTIPFMMCRGRGENARCHYSFRSEKTYWLSTNAAVENEEIPTDENEDHISRCSVCEIESAVLTVHSQSNSIPECPPTWQSVWTGYSFLMVRIVFHVNKCIC